MFAPLSNLSQYAPPLEKFLNETLQLCLVKDW